MGQAPEPDAVIAIVDDDASMTRHRGAEGADRRLSGLVNSTGKGPARMNWTGSPLARSRAKRRMRSCAAAACFLQLASALSAAEPALVRLAVSEGKDIRFAHLTSKERLVPRPSPRHPSGQSGFLVVQHLEAC